MVTIRQADHTDIAALTTLRLALLREVTGPLRDSELAELTSAIERYFTWAVPGGQLVAWIAFDGPDQPIATTSLIFMQRPPTPSNLSGREAYIVNSHVVPQWRGTTIGHRLLHDAVVYA